MYLVTLQSILYGNAVKIQNREQEFLCGLAMGCLIVWVKSMALQQSIQ